MISVHNVDILKQLRLEQVHKIKFTNSKIKKLFAFSGDQILISNCNIKRISRKSEALIYVHNKNNTRNLENNSIQIPQQVKQNFLVCHSCETEVDLFSRFCHDCGSMLK